MAVVTATAQPIGAQETAGGRADKNSKSWEAVAPGLVETRSGEIKIWAPVIGRISEVPVNANDKVLAGGPALEAQLRPHSRVEQHGKWPLTVDVRIDNELAILD